MSDIQKKLRAKFAEANRYSNFGPCLRSMRIQGFRGISDLAVTFEAPITALSGLNGAGKSTIAQLSVCGYRQPSTALGYKRYYVKDFFPVSVADPAPFEANARVEYTYETNQPTSPQQVTVSRTAVEWSGYKRQPEGYVYYVGFTLYIPKVERRDLSVYRGSAIELRGKRTISEVARSHVAKILDQSYTDLSFQSIGHQKKEVELGTATRHGRRYSENNMGFGEGRVLYMVDLMEAAPEQSLFVLEEPETSLHEMAQYRLAEYFLDVVNRRHHQIVLSTHSSTILEALPSESRKLLHRDGDGVTEYPGVSASRAKAILSGGHNRSLSVCVEDHFAKVVVTEMIRMHEPALLKSLVIEGVGDKQAVQSAVQLLQKLKKPVIGIRDGDVGPDTKRALYSLPGARPPEVEVFECAAVKIYLMSHYGVDVDQIAIHHPGLDHHNLPDLIAAQAELGVDTLNVEVIRIYLSSLVGNECAQLIGSIRDLA